VVRPSAESALVKLLRIISRYVASTFRFSSPDSVSWAHSDDIEIGVGGTLLKLAEERLIAILSENDVIPSGPATAAWWTIF
jgi:hypothetical protein